MQRLIILLALFPLCCSLLAQKADSVKLVTAFDRVVGAQDIPAGSPGFSVLVIKNGKVFYERQRGLANVATGTVITDQTIFHTGSVSKQFTAACIFLLEEQGKLRLSDSIQRFLPEVPWLGHTVTLKQVLSHTSGIPDHFEVAILQGNHSTKKLYKSYALTAVKAHPSLCFVPGTDFMYSNTGYMLLALIVERISNMKFEQFAAQHLFAPLGMKDSYVAEENHTNNREALDYEKSPKKPNKKLPNAVGAVGVYTTLNDFMLWDQNFYRNRLGKSDSMLTERMMLSDTLLNGHKVNYGAGLILSPYRRWEQTVSHTGGWGGFLMDCRRFPNSEISIYVASNASFVSPFAIADSLSDIVLKYKAYKFKPQPLEEGVKPTDFCGTYLSQSNLIRHVITQDGKLFVQIGKEEKAKRLELFFIAKREDGGYTFWDEQGEKLYFNTNQSGEITGLSWEGGYFFRVQKRLYEKLPATPSTEQTRSFAGKYKSLSYKQKLTIKYKSRKDKLVLKPRFFLSYQLEPLGGGAFKVKGESVVIRFEGNTMSVGNEWVYSLQLMKQ